MSKLDTIDSFDDMGLKENILRGIYEYGFEKPSDIQRVAIKPLIEGKDMIAQAQSGTGKTGTFSIGTLQLINPDINESQVIILSPTRDLAKQTFEVIKNLSKHTSTTLQLCIGGVRNRVRYTSSNPIKANYIIGTPGRIYDYLINNVVNKNTIKCLVLDEADKMLAGEFASQLKLIISLIPKTSQLALFSATMPDSIVEIGHVLMKNPVKILIKTEDVTLAGLKQFYIKADQDKYKYSIINDLYSSFNITKSMIFCASKKKVRQLAKYMKENNFNVSEIYGDMKQEERNYIMDEFRSGKTRILICSSLLARGVDIPEISLVLMVDPCEDLDEYPHIIGRTARYGKQGISILLLNMYQIKFLQDVEDYWKCKIEELPSDIDNIFRDI